MSDHTCVCVNVCADYGHPRWKLFSVKHVEKKEKKNVNKKTSQKKLEQRRACKKEARESRKD